MKNMIKNQKGISLVEAVFAIGISVIMIVALISLSTFTVRTLATSRTQLEAVKSANALTESVRILRDTCSDWSTFTSKISSCSSSFCEVKTPDCSSSNSVGVVDISNPTDPKCGFKFTYPEATDTTYVQVNVTCNWSVGATKKTLNISTIFSNWRDLSSM